MLSVVLIGRNDNHGYNLSKRVCQSINSIAQSLSTNDEIIFVDWNSPLGYPPMPISIHDDLSGIAKKLLKIVVVPPSIHAQVAGETDKALLEPIARNVGMRRVSKDCKWILNSNTDILLLSPHHLSLSDIAEQYGQSPTVAFRYEIPEFIWESFDRRDPQGIQENLRKWHKYKFLEKNVKITLDVEKALVLPDGVGDFQMATKELWYSVSGFAEDMLRGWHVDTRAAIQMNRFSAGLTFIDSEDLSIYHQNHMRTSTIYHYSSETNDESLIAEAYQNDPNWGLADTDLPILQLKNYQKKSHKGIQLSYELLNQERLRPEGDSVKMQQNLDYSLKHSSAFIMDEIQLLQENEKILLVSFNEMVINWIRNVCMEFNLTLNICNEFTEDLGYFNLIILDLGIESEAPISSPHFFYNYENSIITKNVGQIAMRLESWAEKARLNKSRVLLIRAQNWAIRTMAHKYFNLPLFNNYSGILTGQAKPNNPIKYGDYRDKVYGIIFDYALNAEIASDYGLDNSRMTPNLFRFAKRMLSFFSPNTQLRIKKQIKQRLRF